MGAEAWKTEADEQRDRDLEDEIEAIKADPWCRCGYQFSNERHPSSHNPVWDVALNQPVEAPEGGNDNSREWTNYEP